MNEQEEREAIAAIVLELQPVVDGLVADYKAKLDKLVRDLVPRIFGDLQSSEDLGRLTGFEQSIAVCRAYGAHDVAEALEKAKPKNVPKGGG